MGRNPADRREPGLDIGLVDRVLVGERVLGSPWAAHPTKDCAVSTMALASIPAARSNSAVVHEPGSDRTAHWCVSNGTSWGASASSTAAKIFPWG